MAKQRLVLWTLFGFGTQVDANSPVVIDLDYNSLIREYPALARAIGRGRITSHSTVAWGTRPPIISLVVDDE